MPRRYIRSSVTTAEHIGDYLDTRDQDVMQALVTAGAFVALADGRVEKVERDELVNFIDRQQFVPTIPRTEIAEIFDQRVRQLEDRNSAEVIIEKLRPLAGLSLGSIVIRTAERVAGADRQIHPGELQALALIRLIMTGLSAKGLPARSRSWRKQITLVLLITVVTVGLATDLWAKSHVLVTTGADVTHPDEKSPSASNPHSHSRIYSHDGIDSIDPKDELVPMFNPYLPFRILDPVY
jgi:tellurite resistance protein